MSVVLVWLVLCADGPANVAVSGEDLRAYFELEDKTRESREAFYERETVRLRVALAKAERLRRPGISAEIENMRKGLEKLNAEGTKGYLTESPKVGAVGYIEVGRIVSFPTKNMAVVVLGSGRFAKEKCVLVEGLDSEKFADGTKWEPETPFRAVRVERGSLVESANAGLRRDVAVDGRTVPTSLVVLQAMNAELIEKSRAKYQLIRKGVLEPKQKSK